MAKRATGPDDFWAAGSYLDMFLSSALMILPYLFTLCWLGLNSDKLINVGLEDEISFALLAMAAMGWIMLGLVGIGFNLIPLIRNITPFDPTLMRVFVGLNVGGQLSIMCGVITNDPEIFHTWVTVGMTLLTTSVMVLGPPAFAVFRVRTAKDEKLGAFSHSVQMILPFIGFAILACWIFQDIPGVFAFATGLLINILLMLATCALLLSHFNRRLDWGIKTIAGNRMLFLTVLLLGLAVTISKVLAARDVIDERMPILLFAIQLLAAFLLLNPMGIWRNVKNKENCSPLLVTAHMWLLVASMIAFVDIDSEPTEHGQWHASAVFIFIVLHQTLVGFCFYMHDDHKRIPLTRRSHPITQYASIQLAGAALIWLLWSDHSGRDLLIPTALFMSAIFISYLALIKHWVFNMFFSIDEWYRIPMFYDKYFTKEES